MAISSGRSKIDYEKIEKEDALKKSRFHWDSLGIPYDISTGPSCDLSVPRDLIESCDISSQMYYGSDRYCNTPSRTIRVCAKINPMQYMGFPVEELVERTKRQLTEQISGMVSDKVRFRENMNYDGTITLEAEVYLDMF